MSRFTDRELRRWARPMKPAELQRARAARAFVESEFRALTSDGWDPDHVQFLLQGSAANDTAVEGGSDVDVAVVWNGDLRRPDAGIPDPGALRFTYQSFAQALEWVFYAGTDDGQIALRTRAYDPIAIDVVPAIALTRSARKGFVIPGGLSGHFGDIENWPSLHRAGIDSKDHAVDGAVRPTIRALKAVRDLYVSTTGNSLPLPSFLLEGLAVAAPDAIYSGRLTTDALAVLEWSLEMLRDTDTRERVATPDGVNRLFSASQKWPINSLNNPLVTLMNVLSARDGWGL